MKVLLTGGAGYIGSILSSILIKKKFKVYIIDNLSTGYLYNVNKKARFYKKDIRDDKFLTNLLKKEKIKNVIHLAASMSNDDSIKNPFKYYDNNIYSTFKLLKSCSKAKIQNFIFSSSCAVYGKNQTPKISENHPKNPVAPYGLTKLTSETLLKKIAPNKFNYTILRYFNVVGADMINKNGQIFRNNQLFQNIALSIIESKKLIVFGKKFKTKDGYAIRDYIDVNDLAYLHFKFIEKLNKSRKNYTVNCGYGRGYTVKEVLDKFEKIEGKKINYKVKNERFGDIPISICNNTYLKKIIKWKPKFKEIEKSIKNTIEWNKYLKKNYDYGKFS